MPERILVIEDDDATRYAYERAFARAGYRTQGYTNYFEAAEEIDRGAGALLVAAAHGCANGTAAPSRATDHFCHRSS